MTLIDLIDKHVWMSFFLSGLFLFGSIVCIYQFALSWGQRRR